MQTIKIMQLRKKRKSGMERAQAELNAINTDPRMSEEYRAQKVEEMTAELNHFKFEVGGEIEDLIRAGKEEATRKYNGAEFEGLSEAELTKKLIIENRNRDEASILIDQYRVDTDTLYDLAIEKVSTQSTDAPAYVNAYRSLSKDPIRSRMLGDLVEQNKVSNMNAAEKKYYEQIQSFEEQESAYKGETEKEVFTDSLLG